MSMLYIAYLTPMQMYGIGRCLAYDSLIIFLQRSENTLFRIRGSFAASAGQISQDVVFIPAGITLYLCLFPYSRASHHRQKRSLRFSLIVINFRKIMNPIKIGSWKTVIL